MVTPNSDVTDESGSIPIASPAAQAREKKEQRQFLKSAARDLSEDEIGGAAARRFMIAEIERLDADCESYKVLERSYNDLRVEHASLKAETRRFGRFEFLSYACVSAGSLGLGSAPNFIAVEKLSSSGWVILVGSAVLLIVAVITKVTK